MFTLEQVANIYVYIEYIIPVSIILLLLSFHGVKAVITLLRKKIIDSQHTIIDKSGSPYWKEIYCSNCNKRLYSETTSANVNNHYIKFRISTFSKCKKQDEILTTKKEDLI